MTYLASDMRHGMQSWHRRGRVERSALLSMSGGATRSSARLVAGGPIDVPHGDRSGTLRSAASK